MDQEKVRKLSKRLLPSIALHQLYEQVTKDLGAGSADDGEKLNKGTPYEKNHDFQSSGCCWSLLTGNGDGLTAIYFRANCAPSGDMFAGIREVRTITVGLQFFGNARVETRTCFSESFI